jgi:hypothetical protein
MKSKENQLADKKLEPGRFAEGPRSPGLSCPPPQGASKKLVTAESLEVIESKQRGTTSACCIFHRFGEKSRGVRRLRKYFNKQSVLEF